MLTAVSGRYSNTVTYTYDSAGRKASEALTISGQTYTTSISYDDKGQLTGYTYPDGTLVGRSYTDRGELYQLTHDSTTIDTRTYDDGGRMTGSSYNNGVSQSRGYNSDNTLSTISYSGASIGNMTYGWDDNKNKTSETISGTMSGYGFSIPSSGYDDEDRLVEFNRTDGNLDQQWDLSLVGNWDQLTTEGTAQNRSHGDTHELQSVDSNNLSNDVKGNITLIPSNVRPNSSSLALAWDMDNRLSTADVGDDSSIDMIYKFDALGRRVLRDDGTDATVFVQVGQQTIADYASGATPGNPLYCYVYASYIDEPVLRYQPSTSDSIYFHRNQQYSITALTDGTGTIVERYAYSAYGVPTITDASGMVRPSSQEDNRYLYTGREWDDVLLMYHYRSRMYDPQLGRFCSRDPIGYRGSKWNVFEYVSSRPLRYVDPTGRAELTFGDKCSCVFSCGVLDCMEAKAIGDELLGETNRRYPGEEHNGRGDAWRHCTWNCRMSRELINGARCARIISDINEEAGSRNGQPNVEADMDQHNNRIGRNLSSRNGDCGDLCAQAVNDRILIVISPGPTNNPTPHPLPVDPDPDYGEEDEEPDDYEDGDY